MAVNPDKSSAVDVIIPTYNGLPYLKEAMDSILDQTYKNFTVYIVDDGSTDKDATKKYVDNLTDSRVRYMRKSNGGQATARNYGFGKSSSKYVSFIDSDDIWLPDKLRKQVAYLDKHPDMGMVYGYHYVIDWREKVVGRVKHNAEGHLYNYLMSGNKISGSASMVMVRRSVLDDVGLFHEDFLIGEDWEMWLRVARKYQIGCVHEYLAKLRALPGGMQSNYVKMASGLEFMLPVLLKEFRPGPINRAKLYGACLWDAANYYYMAGDYDHAQKAFRRLLLHNPSKLKLNREYWYMYTRLGMRSAIIRQMRRRLSRNYRQREIEYFKDQDKPDE